ncbi:MAG: C10 family peptidase [Bacteroidetes bacterium]|nr:C10 family peptidase [Bacteroidota bacterium]
MMKKIILSLAMICVAGYLFAAHVSQEDAQKIAIGYCHHYAPAGYGNPVIRDVFVRTYEEMTTFYTFTFESGGFILVAADDASIPVLAYSFEDPMPAEITNPSVKAWLESYSREIHYIVTNHLSNDATVKQWKDLETGNYPPMMRDVNPLVNTTWDQGCFYNALCPAAGGGQCGHVWTGCVATAMAQIMKYHNYPPQGVGSHSYVSPTYGTQYADFGNTTYNWASMPNNVGSGNTAVATLMYHDGVSVNMQYATSGSGAYSEDVPYALMNYFNYHPGIEIKYKNNYTNVEDFKNLIRADLDQQLPVYYSGSGNGEGHAWVCDGYRMSDGMFHFNWGWSGSSNGWYAIGSLNPGGYQFNDGNSVVLHIKPYNPNLIVRIIHPVNNAVIGVGYSVQIEAVIVRGTASNLKLYIDNIEKVNTTNDTLIYNWSTSSADLGSHAVTAYAITSTSDTVYYTINLNVAEWISQSSGFTTPSRGINYLSAVDSNIVWGTAMDANNPTGACSDFTRTLDGGTTWIPGVIPNTTGLASAMIFAMNADTAYVPMYKVSGSKPQGIYVTVDGGATWAKQTTALFTNANSFPDCVHFFNTNEGWALGDPINGEYEIYTTIDGGTTWTAIPGADIPNPLSGEFGVVGYYSAVHDTVWFGTNKGRVYKSTDKGHTYTVSTVTGLTGKYIKPTFRTGLHGLVQDKDAGTTGTLYETFDGGETWTLVTATGTIYSTDLAYVPNTTNTWVSSGSSGTNGSGYSFNGGHNWSDFIGTQGSQYMQMAWVNNHCGWAGGINADSTENGVFKFIGFLMPPLPAPINLDAVVLGHDVHLTWNAPTYDSTIMTLIGYNMYRDGLLLNVTPITGLIFDDADVLSGQHNYCVKALYNFGESTGDCKLLDVAVSVLESQDNPRIIIYPNPAYDFITIKAASPISEILMYDHSGKQVYQATGNSTTSVIHVSDYPAGLYLLSVITPDGTFNSKLMIK